MIDIAILVVDRNKKRKNVFVVVLLELEAVINLYATAGKSC